MRKQEYIIILVTAKNNKEAAKIAKALLKQKLIACANLIDTINSFYWWQGKVEGSKETLMILKTRQSALKALTTQIKLLHSYANPEIIALPILGGSKEYLKWIGDNVC